MNLLHALLAINLGALLLLGLCLFRLRRRAAGLRQRADQLSGQPAVPGDLQRLAREGGVLLSIRILNPVELAANKHWMAGIAGRVTPGIVRRVVGSEAIKICNQELRRHGVVADVRVVSGD